MSATTTAADEKPRVGRAPALHPRWWQGALLVYGLSRVVSTLLVLLVIAVARPGSRIGLHASPLDVLTAWDGQWFRLISQSGYPARLPHDALGVAENAWAFLPVYPFTVRVLSFGVPAAWPLTAVLVSTAAGGVATVLLAALVRPHVGDRGAVVTAALFALSPVAFVLESAYAESLGLTLLFGVLLLADRRRYLAAVPVVVVLAFTRPGLQALLLHVLVLHGVRAVRAHREGRRLPRREWAGAIALAAAALVGGLAWPAVAGAATGDPQAYLATELAWRRIWVGSATMHPFTAWIAGAGFWFGGAGPLVLALLAAGFVALLRSRRAREAGATVRIWTVSWTLYLLAAVFPQSSTFRLFMPAAPIGAVLARARTRTVVAVLVVSVVLQAGWIVGVDGYWARFWTVP